MATGQLDVKEVACQLSLWLSLDCNPIKVCNLMRIFSNQIQTQSSDVPCLLALIGTAAVFDFDRQQTNFFFGENIL